MSCCSFFCLCKRTNQEKHTLRLAKILRNLEYVRLWRTCISKSRNVACIFDAPTSGLKAPLQRRPFPHPATMQELESEHRRRTPQATTCGIREAQSKMSNGLFLNKLITYFFKYSVQYFSFIWREFL